MSDYVDPIRCSVYLGRLQLRTRTSYTEVPWRTVGRYYLMTVVFARSMESSNMLKIELARWFVRESEDNVVILKYAQCYWTPTGTCYWAPQQSRVDMLTRCSMQAHVQIYYDACTCCVCGLGGGRWKQKERLQQMCSYFIYKNPHNIIYRFAN